MKSKIELTAKQFENLVRDVSRHVTENARAIVKAGGNVRDLLCVLEHQTAYTMDDSGRLKISFLDASGRESMLTADDIVTTIKLQKTFPACFPDSAETSSPSAAAAASTQDLSGLSAVERLKIHHRQQTASTR